MFSSKKKLTLIIVPPENGKVINREISQRLLVLGSLVISCFILASVYSAIGFIRTTVDRQKMKGLISENQVLSAKVGDLESTVAMLKSDMSKIVSMDENIRLVFDLPPLDNDIREVGVGGEKFEPPIVGSELTERTWLVQEDIEKIHRQIELENASFGQLYDLVSQRKNELDHTPTIRPCDGYMSRGFGMHNDPFTGSYQPHTGIDIAAPKGTPVHATAAGVVIGATFRSGLGNVVTIDHGNGISTCYGHLSKIMAVVGQKVTRGDLIGQVGSTGYSTGPHLHYEVRSHQRAMDPGAYIVKSILSIS